MNCGDHPHFTQTLFRLTQSLLWLLLGVLPVASASFAAQAQPDSLTIAIIQPHNLTAYHEAVQGFLEYLGKHLERDFNTIIFESPQGLYAALASSENSANSPVHPQIDLILTVGTEATAAVAQTITEIPTLFTMVLDPERVLNHRHDIVGASLNIPAALQLKMIKKVVPKARKIGILYDPAHNTQFVQHTKTIAGRFHLEVELFPVTSPKMIPDALKQLSKNVDALWGIVDQTVYTSNTAKFIIRYTVEKHLPFVGLSPSYVKAGALCSLVFDSHDIGRQAAELAVRILSGTPAAALHTTTPENIQLAVNLRTADIIGVTIPQEVREHALIVYE